MVVDIKAVNDIIKNYVNDVKMAMPIDKVVLFGSYAKGTQTSHSDIDLCFFSNSFENQRLIDVTMELFRIRRRKYKGIDIEPHAFPTSELDRDNPFVKEILRTGKELQ